MQVCLLSACWFEYENNNHSLGGQSLWHGLIDILPVDPATYKILLTSVSKIHTISITNLVTILN